MPLPGGKSFDEFVRQIKRKQGITDEAARKIAGSIEQKVQKAKLSLKLMSMKYASVHGSEDTEPFPVKQTPTIKPKQLIQMQRQPKSPLPTKKRTAGLHIKKNKKTPIVSDGKPQKTVE